MNERILIVEDELVFAKELQSKLERMGYAVTGIAITGEDALRQAEEDRPDLILMDIKLSGSSMDGIEIVNQVITRFNIPVIYLTAYSDQDTVQRAKVSHSFGYILKPLRERELETNIEIALYKHKTEQALRDSEAKYRLLFKAVPVGIGIADYAGNILDGNQSMLAMTGYTLEELRQIPVKDIYANPNDRQQVLITLQKEGRVQNWEVTLQRKDGTVYTALLNIDQIVFQGQKALLTTARDISDRKRAEEALQQLKKAVETMHVGVTITDPDRKILYTNPAEAEMHGYHPEDLPGRDVGILAPSEHRKTMTLEQMRTMTTWKRESVNIRKDGNIFPVQLISDVVRDPAGEPTAIVTVCENITERKRAEDKIRKVHNLNKMLLDTLPHPAMMISGDRKVMALNKIAEEFGVTVGSFCWEEFGKCMYIPEEKAEGRRRKAMTSIQHPASSIQHPASSIQHPVTSIQLSSQSRQMCSSKRKSKVLRQGVRIFLSNRLRSNSCWRNCNPI